MSYFIENTIPDLYINQNMYRTWR